MTHPNMVNHTKKYSKQQSRKNYKYSPLNTPQAPPKAEAPISKAVTNVSKLCGPKSVERLYNLQKMQKILLPSLLNSVAITLTTAFLDDPQLHCVFYIHNT